MVASKATFIRPAMAAHNQIGPHYLKWHRITSRNMLIRHHRPVQHHYNCHQIFCQKARFTAIQLEQPRHILSIQSSSAIPNKKFPQTLKTQHFREPLRGANQI